MKDEQKMEQELFSAEEKKAAENMLTILAHKSADFWVEALLSECFVVNGERIDYTTGYKNRVEKIVPDPNASPISAQQIQIFRKEYLELAADEMRWYLNNNIALANLLQKKERVLIPIGKDCTSFSFGGWDNDPYGMLASAMKKANITGKMNGGFTKTTITLLAEDGAIHDGWHRHDPIIYKVR